ncbi:hypothetical protein OAN307_c03360 [Octadecabacter antarcticus 307]|uniref:Sulfotransferase domain-containing protein n=1 Tax=Octadecabacter antarcticus 307 TaxID=391626 RepID=M9R6Y7_9RHOB|nr:hypothetical protein [Octadecabacter antarcticus]AGI66091.1 hypothetical protein OAN307_c03360 [Octadecabacter antarcticus 307]
MLSDEGIRYCGPSYLRRRGRNLAAMFGLSWSEAPMPHRTAHEQLAFLSKGNERLVFSEENFVEVLSDKEGRVSLPVYPSAIERVTELVAAWAPIKPQLFVAVRNPATFLASAYSQVLFGSAFIAPNKFRAHNDWRKIDWAGYIAKLRTISGVGDIYVWRQEDYDLTHRLILRRLLRWKVGGNIETIEGRVHQSLSAAAVRQTLAWAQDGGTVKLAAKSRKLFPINADNKPFGLYTTSTLAQADAVYDAQMAQIEALDGVTVLKPPKRTLKGLKSPAKTVN